MHDAYVLAQEQTHDHVLRSTKLSSSGHSDRLMDELGILYLSLYSSPARQINHLTPHHHIELVNQICISMAHCCGEHVFDKIGFLI